MQYRLRFLAPLALALALVPRAPGMIRHVFIVEPPVALEQYDAWYLTRHSQECIRFFGPWLRRFEMFRSRPVPSEADRFNVYRGRYMELWYENVEAWREAAPFSGSYTPAPWANSSTGTRPTASVIVPARPTEDFLGNGPGPTDAPIFRWIFAMKYPEGVSLEAGEKWYLEVHTQEAKRMPGLLRYISYKAIANSPAPSPWVRVSECWFKDYNAWHVATSQSGIKYTAPAWAAHQGQSWLDVAAAFVGYEPDVNFLAGRPNQP